MGSTTYPGTYPGSLI